jgi:hypothetical protein
MLRCIIYSASPSKLWRRLSLLFGEQKSPISGMGDTQTLIHKLAQDVIYMGLNQVFVFSKADS